jgi:periplasmic copper chaperone A
MRTITLALCGATMLALPGTALAHITLEQQEAAAGSTYKAVLRLGHGCEGSPTTTVRVQIPDGVINVKPMPKAGWELTTKVEPYPEPMPYRDTVLTEGVREITWSGGSVPDEWYEEFVFRGQLPDGEPGTVIYFPTVQECHGGGIHRWIEIPEEGQTRGYLEEPAPQLTLTPGE